MDEIKRLLEEAQNQLAVETLRADEAEAGRAKEKARADSLEGERDGLKSEVSKLQAERADGKDDDADQLRRQIKALQTQVAAQKRRADEAEAAQPEKIRARVELQVKAGQFLDPKARLDQMTDRDVMAAVVERLQPGTDLKDRSDDYVRARFDSAVEAYARGSAALDRAREVVQVKAEPRADGRSARQKFLDEQANLWRQAAAEAK